MQDRVSPTRIVDLRVTRLTTADCQRLTTPEQKRSARIGAIGRHMIDILERGYDVILTTIGLAPLAALILLAVACIQAERRGQRTAEGQVLPPPADR